MLAMTGPSPAVPTHTFAYLVSSDMARFTGTVDPWWKAVHRGFHRPGLWASILVRAQQRITERGHWNLGGVLRSVGVVTLGLDITAGAKIGPGLKIEHPTGVMIGGSVVIGSNVTIHQGVDVGVKDATATGEGIPQPVLEDGVLLGSRSAVYGGVTVGKDAMVGAYSVVMSDVAPGAVVVGIPAKPLRR